MSRAFVSAGSNIEPGKNIRVALRLLASQVQITAISTVYLTEPIGRSGQPAYYNCVVRIMTDLSPLELKQKVLQPVENELGRIRSADKFAPRTIDLDLILYDRLVISDGTLTLPDPDIVHRPFLIAALYELEPDMILPGTETLIAKAARELRYDTMKPLAAYTAGLREGLRNGF